MRREGFSLVEISIVLVVVGVMISGVLPYITESQKTNAANDTAARLEAIELAMLTFRAANGFIPCPSRINAPLNDANFGRADTVTGCATIAGGTVGWQASGVAAGGVPTKDLGLADEYGFDGWGRRMTYHVTIGLTGAGYEAGAGALIINDYNNNVATPRTDEAAYAVVSHGPNGHGAFTRAGARFSFGSTNDRERENCGCNTSGATTGTVPFAFDNVLVQSMAMPNTDPLAAFDDIVRYQLKPSLELLVGGGGGGSSSCTGIAPSGWPDAIVCAHASYPKTTLFFSAQASTGNVTYRHISTGGQYDITYNSSKAYVGQNNLGTYDCVTGTMSIDALEAAGKTFTFCGGSGGAGWVDVPLTDTANFDVNCQYRIEFGTEIGTKYYAGYIKADEIHADKIQNAGPDYAFRILKASKGLASSKTEGSASYSGSFAVQALEKNCGGGGGGGGGVSFSANYNRVAGLTADTDQKLAHAALGTDSAGAYNSGTATYTVPATGDYLISGTVHMTQTGSCPSCYGHARIFRNGAFFLDGFGYGGNGWVNSTATRVVTLAAGDTLELYGRSGNSAATNVSGTLSVMSAGGGGGGGGGGMTYVGSCSPSVATSTNAAVTTNCTCGLGETLMMVTQSRKYDVTGVSAGQEGVSACRVMNQNTGTVRGEAYSDAFAGAEIQTACTFACFTQ